MQEALTLARQWAGKDKVLCITGSLYLTGELRNILVNEA
jgi:dihydrofolate synthase/folylpolyglutamate synthase